VEYRESSSPPRSTDTYWPWKIRV
ncbi:unnamed protein product, partial [Didymodactylos carnosus]